MSTTYCVGAFAQRIGRVPATREAYRAELATLPATCDRNDCSPGGCRKHCTDYARGAFVVATSPSNRPAKPTKKPVAKRIRR